MKFKIIFFVIVLFSQSLFCADITSEYYKVADCPNGIKIFKLRIKHRDPVLRILSKNISTQFSNYTIRNHKRCMEHLRTALGDYGNNLVATHDENVVGFISTFPYGFPPEGRFRFRVPGDHEKSITGDTYLKIELLLVKQEYRRNGIAKQLVECAIQNAIKRFCYEDIKRVRTIVASNNPIALAFYRSLGFIPSMQQDYDARFYGDTTYEKLLLEDAHEDRKEPSAATTEESASEEKSLKCAVS